MTALFCGRFKAALNQPFWNVIHNVLQAVRQDFLHESISLEYLQATAVGSSLELLFVLCQRLLGLNFESRKNELEGAAFRFSD
jgi:hypothetical protein